MIAILCNQDYIGQTNRTFHFRYEEHEYSLNKRNNISALSEHLYINRIENSISTFHLTFLEKFKSAVDCKIREAVWIRFVRRTLNRKQELTHW